MARLWRNHTDLPDHECRRIYKAVCPSGLPAHDVRISNLDGYGGRGAAYFKGSGYHSTARPFVVVSITRHDRHARLISSGGGGYLPHNIGSRLEWTVFLLAHELRHLWQAKVKRGHRVWGSRGQFSERDCDAYALQMLRRYRRGEL